MRECPFRSPERVPEKLILHRHGYAVESGELVWRSVDHAFGARAIVATDIDDQCVVEFAQVFDRLDNAANLMVRISEICSINVRLLDEELLLFPTQRVPLRQTFRPRRQFRILGHNAEPLLIGEDLFANFVPALIE
jgi:hypothetical protein